ncbi:MAG: hypothetical protein JJ891_15405 [Rhizobiaceae bacterium]|nr:hypothetical protein [Rhizobiaceae bacterium]
MENLDITFAPELPVWLLIAISGLIALFCLYGLIHGLRGSWLRSVAGGLLILALFNPALLQEDRSPLKTVIPLVIDETTSQRMDGRDEQTAAAVEQIREEVSKHNGFELREVRVRDQISQTSDVSSALFGALSSASQDIPRERIGGAIFVTDGQVHDVPDSPDQMNASVPLHVILTGRENEKDRRIILKNSPRFGVVGESQEILYQIEETGFDERSEVDVTISIDGEIASVERVIAGEEASFVFDVPHGGKNIIEFQAEVAEGEISEINNQTFTTVNGIRENLRVLLISGEPHAGERTWRNLLKSDASVDLVHFTILRPPEKQDGTPINQLSLIAFPTRELFIQKIDEFDLIIFDRYKRRGVLPVLYFDNIARYVQNGGAVMVAAGPEYADVSSISVTPLNSVLPGTADGAISEQPFVPQISDTGEKHPVTRNLDGWNAGEPDWSRWFRSVGIEPDATGETLMLDGEDRPLLMLERHNEGRVALFLSDHVWLWSRGFEGGGPHVQLLRRLAHWLMKEPELEEERLTAESRGETLTILRQTLGEKPDPVELLSPSGLQTTHEFERLGPGAWQIEQQVEEIGLYRVTNGDLNALAQVGPANPRELAAVTSTPDLLEPVVRETQGSISRYAEAGIPSFIPVSSNATRAGRGWAGLVNTNASVLNGVFRIPLFTGLLGLALLLLGFAAMWFREGK